MEDQVANGGPQSELKSPKQTHDPDNNTPERDTSPPVMNTNGEDSSSRPNELHTLNDEATPEDSTVHIQKDSPKLADGPETNTSSEITTDRVESEPEASTLPNSNAHSSTHSEDKPGEDKPASPLRPEGAKSHDIKDSNTDQTESQGDNTLPPSPLATEVSSKETSTDEVQTPSSEEEVTVANSEEVRTTSPETVRTASSEEIRTTDSTSTSISSSEEVATSKPSPSDSNAISAVTQVQGVSPQRSDVATRTGDDDVQSQTSFVNEFALSSTAESPTYEADRNLEQFSEILLDSDPSPSDAEPQAEEAEDISPKKKNVKRVRFADQMTGKVEGSPQGHTSPPPPPSSLPDHPDPSSSSKHPGVPITPSPTSPKQKVPRSRYTVEQLINGVDMQAEYLGSTPIVLDGLGAMKSARMFQAQQAVQLIKDPESESRPHFAVKLKVSTEAIRIADSTAGTDLMEHPLHTITYVADIDRVLVIMAHIRPPPLSSPAHQTSGSNGRGEGEKKYIPKMTCHVLDIENAREAAVVIGQAFSAAYKQFLRSSGISDQQLEQAEYAHILNAQSVPKLEVESLGDRNKIKKLTLAKHKNEIMGMMVMESGYGSAIPACVIVHLSKTGAATKCGLLNVGDHILSINGVNLVGMPRKACIEQIKKCRYMNVVKMEVCSCPAVVDVTIVRPDLKYQLGFSVHEGMICSLVRGSIAERSGVRVGHRIIDINGTSTVGMAHSDTVHLLSSTVGDLHIRMMPDIMYRLLIGKLQPQYC